MTISLTLITILVASLLAALTYWLVSLAPNITGYVRAGIVLFVYGLVLLTMPIVIVGG